MVDMPYDKRHSYHGFPTWYEYPLRYTNGDAVFNKADVMKVWGKCSHCGQYQLMRECNDLVCFVCGWRKSDFYKNRFFAWMDNFLAKDFERIETMSKAADKELYELYAKRRLNNQSKISHEKSEAIILQRKKYQQQYKTSHRDEVNARARERRQLAKLGV